MTLTLLLLLLFVGIPILAGFCIELGEYGVKR
jgi:hypothetical protein